nr:CBS domain-containing protein [Candidatus Methanomethylophilus sp. 1R26]
MKTVADIMTPAPIVVEVPGSRNEAINVMVRNNLTGVPVIRASDGKLMGIVSRRDIFRKFDEEQLSLIMKKDCITIGPDASVAEAAKILSGKRIHSSRSSTTAASSGSSRLPISSARSGA